MDIKYLQEHHAITEASIGAALYFAQKGDLERVTRELQLCVNHLEEIDPTVDEDKGKG
jgi:hypothetical protein